MRSIVLGSSIKSLGGWKQSLMLFQPKTVAGWQRKSFRLCWRWKSRHKEGRSGVDPKTAKWIRIMWTENSTWGAPTIRRKLLKLGIRVSTGTIQNYRPRQRKSDGQRRSTFRRNHMNSIVGVDFLIVATVTFRVLYVFYRPPTRAEQGVAFQQHRVSDSNLDRETNRERISFCHCLKVFASGPRRNLWGRVQTPNWEPWNERVEDRAAIPVAESIHRADDRDHTARVFGSHDYLQQTPATSHSGRIHGLPSSRSSAQITGRRFARWERNGGRRGKENRIASRAWWIASPLHAKSVVKLRPVHAAS